MSQRLDYASLPLPSPPPKLPLFIALAAVLFAAGSAIPSSLISRRVFDQSPGGGGYGVAMLVEPALSLGGIVCGCIALGTGLYHRRILAALLGLLGIVVSLASAGVCAASPWPRSYVPL